VWRSFRGVTSLWLEPWQRGKQNNKPQRIFSLTTTKPTLNAALPYSEQINSFAKAIEPSEDIRNF
jgi:hypothetical protein